MSTPLGHVLMTSAARKVPLLRALQEAARRIDPTARVIAGDIDAGAPTRIVADGFWQMPALDETSPGDLAEQCLLRGIRTILPTRDGELAYWAATKPTFAEAGIEVIVSAPEVVALCLDKLAFSEWGKARSLPVIPAAIAPEVFGSRGLVVKERFGAGSQGIGMNLEPQAARRHAQALSNPIYQPFINGAEISIDSWTTSAGRVHGLVLRRRDRVMGGESQITTTFRDPVLEAQAAQILAPLGLSGPAVMQAVITDVGLAVIEVNARFGGASTASLAVGLDTLHWSLLERVDARGSLPPFTRHAGEIRQFRVPQDIVIHDPDL